MKLLFLIAGGSFRKGSSRNRNYGVKNTEVYNNQINIAKRHMEFLNHIKDKYNIGIDIVLSTYSTPYDNELISIYKNNIVGEYIYPYNNGSGLKGIHNLFHLAYKNHLNNYNGIFFFRVDIFLKQKLFDIFNPFSKKILFPFIVSINNLTSGRIDHKNPDGHPVHSDMLLFVPEKYFNVINYINLGHATWSALVGGCYGFFKHQHPILYYEDFDVMIDTHHDSDSELDWNPLYYTINRGISEKWHDKVSRFNIGNYNIIHKINEGKLTDSLKEQKKLFSIKNTTHLNPDMLYKQGIILKYIEDNNIIPKNIIDVGAGHTNLSLYLIKNYNSNYIGVDIQTTLKNGFINCLDLNNIENNDVDFTNNTKIKSWSRRIRRKPRYKAIDFFNFNPEGEKFDLIYDMCAIIHFDTKKQICENDGIYKAGLTIKNILTDDGIFIFTADCGRGEYSKEYVKPMEMLKGFYKAGLKLVDNTITFCSKENIKKYTSTNIYNLHNELEIKNAYPDIIYDSNCATHDVIFFVMKK